MGNRPSYFRLDPLELHRYLLEFKTNMNEIDYEGIGKAFCEIRDELLAGSFSDSKNPFAKSLIAEAERFRAIKSANGSKGGRPRKNFPDTRGGSASPAGCAAGKRIPPKESTTAAGESAEKLDPTDVGGSAASVWRAPRSPRAGEVSDSPEVSESSDAANRCFASPAGCAAGKRIPPKESTTAAGESAEKLDPTDVGGSAASVWRAPRSPRAGEVSDSPEVSESSDAANRCFASPAEGCAAGKRIPPSTAELYDFAEAARLSEADAREWWELCTERGWKDRSGKPIRDWKKACERYCARRAINRMAKGET